MTDNNGIRVAECNRLTHESESKTALYCRTAVRDDFAIQNQIERLSAFALANGYKNPAFYIDNGERGSTLCRPGLQDMILDIESGVIDVVIVKDFARLCRNHLKFYELINLMTANGVRLISIAEGSAVNGTDGSYTEAVRLLRLLIEGYEQTGFSDKKGAVSIG